MTVSRAARLKVEGCGYCTMKTDTQTYLSVCVSVFFIFLLHCIFCTTFVVNKRIHISYG